jgi:type 1 glutamine amidotransferase
MKITLTFLTMIFVFGAVQSQRVLIYTKNGKGYVHDNISTSIEAISKICRKNKLTVDTSSNPAIMTTENLKKYKCLIFSNTNNETFDTEEQKKAFATYIKKGGGYVGIHSSTGSERKWPWFWAMQGAKFLRHPPLQKFKIKVIDHNHPATSMLDSIWNWEDEPYYLHHFNPDIHILLAADLTTVVDSQKVQYPGTVFGDYLPLSWCHTYDGGRQFYTALGHKKEYYYDPTYLAHLEGGILWALNKYNKK